MGALAEIFATSRAAQPHIVLAEGEDPRVVEAALRAGKDALARITLLGDGERIAMLAGADGAGLMVIDPTGSDRLDAYTAAYQELRAHKGVDAEAARRVMSGTLGFAAMMVRQGDADGTIAGAVATTADTVRMALQVIGRAPGIDTVSSCFLMLLQPDERPVVFADCGLVVEPSEEELASIALASAGSFRALTGGEPRVAFLSFSTRGSAQSASVERSRGALERVRAADPGLIVDGELQFDSATVPEIARRKAPDSPLAGDANVFIFPSLDAGNIGYKIAQRIGGATALGPVLQGLAHPANDLSRGCSADDIFQMIAVTGAQAVASRKL